MLSPRQLLAGFAALLVVGVLIGWSALGDAPAPRDLGADVVRFGANAATPDPFNVVFDEGVIHTYDLTIAPDDLQWLNENALREEWVRGAVSFDGQQFDAVGVRYKGFYGMLRFCFDGSGNPTCDKLAFKLKFNQYDPRGRLHGLKRLNFHSMHEDDSNLREALSYALFREADVVAPRTAFAWLTLNGEPQGLFLVVEEIDDRFVAANFADGGAGHLYKEVWPEDTEAAPYLEALDRTIPAWDNPDVSPFQAFAGDLIAAQGDDPESDAGVYQVIRDRTDIDALLRYVAVDRFVDNWDGIVAWYCVEVGTGNRGRCFNHNYFWYQDSRSQRFTLIPWDLEHTFEYPSPIRTWYRMPAWEATEAACHLRPVFLDIPARAPSCDPFLHALATAGWADYVAVATEVLSSPAFQVEALHARVDALAALIEDAVGEDRNGPHRIVWREAVRELKENIVAVREQALEALELER